MPERSLAAPTVGEAVARASKRLAAAGCDAPRLDAELLLARVLGHDSRTRLLLDADERLAVHARAPYEDLIKRRERREPVAYILGWKHFRRIALQVDARVLIPRPETETLVEAGVSLPRGWRVADAGSGSGAVALALKDERPDLAVTAIECSRDALDLARSNRDRLGLDIALAHADLLDDGHYDAVLANLPYVASDAPLAPEIALFEPPAALYGGADGLACIGRLAAQLSDRPEVRFVALEVGCDQAAAVASLLHTAGFRAGETRRDLAGHERVVVGKR